MSRKIWIKNDIKITYGNGSITSFGEEDIKIKNMEDVLYFYYDISILFGNKEIFKAEAYDFPKVQNLHEYIDYIINFDMNKAYLIEDYKKDEFHRKVKYNQVILEDMNVEYFYKIERYDTSVKQRYEDKYKQWTEYILTIGIGEMNKEGYSDREDYGKCIYIKLSKEDLLGLKQTSMDFCGECIKEYNEQITIN